MQSNTLGLPSQAVLTAIIRNWAADPTKFIGASVLPMRDLPSDIIEYDEIGPVQGLANAHSLDADPRLVKQQAVRRHSVSPGYWKETMRWTESDLLKVRRLMTFDQRAGEELIVRGLAAMNIRLESRLEWIRWNALQGSVAVNQSGVIYTDTYAVQTFNPGTAWSNPAADVLGDLNAVAIKFRGTGSVMSGGRMFMNRLTSNYLMANTELTKFVANNPESRQYVTDAVVTEVFTRLVGATPIVYDEGYLDDSATFQPFIPDGKIVVVANGTLVDELGYFGTTPSLHNGGIANPQPGKFAVVDDDTMESNPTYDVTTGIYGGPVLYHPNWVCLINAA